MKVINCTQILSCLNLKLHQPTYLVKQVVRMLEKKSTRALMTASQGFDSGALRTASCCPVLKA